MQRDARFSLLCALRFSKGVFTQGKKKKKRAYLKIGTQRTMNSKRVKTALEIVNEEWLSVGNTWKSHGNRPNNIL